MKIRNTFWDDIKTIEMMTFIKSLICCFLNLLIYAIVFVMLFGLDQSRVFAVDLFEYDNGIIRSINIIVFHGLLYYLAYLMSLYPTYIYTVLFSETFNDNENKLDKDKYVFYRKSKGIVYFDKKNSNSDSYCEPKHQPDVDLGKLSVLESIVRKLTAVGLFTIWSWLVFYTYFHHQVQFDSSKWFWTFILAVISILMIWVFWYFTIHCKRVCGVLRIEHSNEHLVAAPDDHNTIANQEDVDLSKEYKSKINFYAKFRYVLLLSATVLIVVIANFFRWSLITVLIEFLVTIVFSLDLIIVRSFRKHWPSVFGLKKPCDHLVYLSRIRVFFFLVLGFFLTLNLCDYIAVRTSAIVVALCGLIVFYYLTTLFIKYYLYYKYRERKEGYYNYKSLAFVTSAFIGFLYFSFQLVEGNTLHNLVEVPQETSAVSVKDYYEKYIEFYDNTSPVKLYAAYGGGLKANYWNLLVLDKLKKSNKMNNILAMSGVSGGAMGMANHTIMEYRELQGETIDRDVIIDDIAGSNVLSLELSYYFGFDFIRNMMPEFLVTGRNRSARSMEWYDRYHGGKGLASTVSFDAVYGSIFKEKYYPNIIFNSCAAIDKYGVASAVRDTSNNIFPNSINILDIEDAYGDKTISFLEAASTSNRFPVISPAADVRTKGTFVDGGYYENSGIMSLISFKNAIEKHEEKDSIAIENSLFREKIQMISVTNYETSYLHSLVREKLGSKEDKFRLNDNDDYTGVSAIIKSIANLERNPSYFREMLDIYYDDEYELKHIDLPFYLTRADVEKMYGGILRESDMDSVMVHVNRSNTVIDSLLEVKKYDIKNMGIINPPTSRVLSQPVEDYMKIMIDHPRVQKQLELLSKE